MNKLRPYQQEIARAVLDSVWENKGLTFSVEIARQGGKNELSAILEVTLLTLHILKGGSIVKASPTFKPQTVISMERLKARLNDFGYAGTWHTQLGYLISLGNARTVFLSAEESSSVVGHTADILLEIDESQDISKDKYTKEFRPMGSSTNVTTVHYGTTWDDSTLLEEIKQSNLELEKKDGVRRHFRYDWQEVARCNPAYGEYVLVERDRLGENHPLFLTQYALEPIHGGGRLFSNTQRALLQGGHARHERVASKFYVAGIDLAGESEGAGEAGVGMLSPRQDSTVITIAEVKFNPEHQPTLEIVEHHQWTGKKHTESYQAMVHILRDVWHCRRVVVDATGIGEPVASFLKNTIGSRIVPFKFSQQSKSELGFELLAAVNAGRLKVYQRDSSPEEKQFWFEMEKAKAQYRPNQTMNFFVDPSEGHDDFLMSLALTVEAARAYGKPKIATGKREAIIA